MKQLSYEDFVEKFKPAKTTDDCYTPVPVYEAVVTYCEERYGISRDHFVRPFYPGGDYQGERYPHDCAVVDNPPFSILTQIIDFYLHKGIKFFLFAPALTLFSGTRKGHPKVCYIGAQATIIYENGAVVATSFITNMEAPQLRSDPDLRKKIMIANKQESKKQASYIYPDEVITAADLGYLSAHGIELSIKAEDALFIRALDSQRTEKKAIFGGGFLLAERAAAERAAAERAAAERAAAERAAATKWPLSQREKQAVRFISNKEIEL